MYINKQLIYFLNQTNKFLFVVVHEYIRFIVTPLPSVL